MDETTQIMVDGAVLELPEGREVAFPAALMNGDLLEYVYEGNDFTGGYSLAGLTASVIWAEAQQGGPSTENRRLVRRTPDWEALAEQSAEIAGEICDYMGLDTDAPAGERRRIDTVPGAPELRRVTNRCWLAAYNAGSGGLSGGGRIWTGLILCAPPHARRMGLWRFSTPSRWRRIRRRFLPL